MASAARKGAQRKARSDVEEPRHPGFRSECWPRSSVTTPDSCHREVAAWEHPARRGRNRQSQSASLHRPRPSQPAEALMWADEGQPLTD
jgi:hypothetical protein